MSTVNAVTIYAENLQGANLVVGNTSSNLTVTANSIAISIGDVTINSTAILVGNATHNTAISATALTTNSITVNTVSYTKVVSDTVLVDYQVFTSPVAANFWYKPAWAQANDIVTIQLWGGGGGGNSGGPACGGGGACVIVNKLAGECDSQCNVIVGAAGTAGVGGGNSIFWSNSSFSIISYGGNGANSTQGGTGGGWFGGGQIGITSNGPVSGNTSVRDSTFGGGVGGSNTTLGGGGASVYGGGGGRWATSQAQGGKSLYGGGGGSITEGGVAVSTFGGNGGSPIIAASAPGGGGSANNTAGLSGARGEVRIWVTGQAR